MLAMADHCIKIFDCRLPYKFDKAKKEKRFFFVPEETFRAKSPGVSTIHFVSSRIRLLNITLSRAESRVSVNRQNLPVKLNKIYMEMQIDLVCPPCVF